MDLGGIYPFCHPLHVPSSFDGFGPLRQTPLSGRAVLMPMSLILACLWALIAGLVGMGPRRYHWPAAWGLIATGIPILGSVTWQMGPVWGLVVLFSGASVLRWPLLRAIGRIRKAVTPGDKG